MKKLLLWTSVALSAGALTFLSCDDETVEPDGPMVTGDACDTLVYPTSTGDATVDLQFDISCQIAGIFESIWEVPLLDGTHELLYLLIWQPVSKIPSVMN